MIASGEGGVRWKSLCNYLENKRERERDKGERGRRERVKSERKWEKVEANELLYDVLVCV